MELKYKFNKAINIKTETIKKINYLFFLIFSQELFKKIDNFYVFILSKSFHHFIHMQVEFFDKSKKNKWMALC